MDPGALMVPCNPFNASRICVKGSACPQSVRSQVHRQLYTLEAVCHVLANCTESQGTMATGMTFVYIARKDAGKRYYEV
jgi:hypothetical protein